MNTKTREELQTEIELLRRKVDEIDMKERDAENAVLVGRYFKYQNTFDGDQHWWQYSRVTHTDQYGYPVAIHFERVFGGSHFIIQEEPIFYKLEGHEEISRGEYEDAWKAFIVELNAQAT